MLASSVAVIVGKVSPASIATIVSPCIVATQEELRTVIADCVSRVICRKSTIVEACRDATAAMVTKDRPLAVLVNSPNPAVRIAIADRRPLVREGLRALLQMHGGLMVTAEIADGDEILASLASAVCDVLLLDRGMPLVSTDIRELSESVHVLVLCSDDHDPGDALNAVRSGARGVVFHGSTVPDFVEAIRAVAAGRVSMPAELQARVAEMLNEEPRARLTAREREITMHVANGLRNSEIARLLFISEQTVKTHLGRIFRKVSVRDRIGLTLYASRCGLVARPK
jgi:DNA-binding NarL/FixJ family response regulator